MAPISGSVEHAVVDAPAPGGRPADPWPSPRRAGFAVAGPVLIVALVLWLMRAFAFEGLVSRFDVVQYWLPMWTFLGHSLRAGHIPAWNPYVLSGTPFAADPQSGWMQFPVMILFTLLRPDLAIRWAVVLNPIVGGLGMYAFLRGERASRVAATIGGLALASPLASAVMAVTLRFPGSLAWTAVTLAAASRYLRAERWSARLTWAVLVALAWMQVAASHLTVGLLIGSLALLAFIAAKLVVAVRSKRWSPARAAGITGVMVAALPTIGAAFLLPRLAFSPRTSLSLGYAKLATLGVRLTGVAGGAGVPGETAPARWPLTLSTVPGRYLGAVVLLLAFAGFWSKRHRAVVIALAAFALVCYVFSLPLVVRNIPTAVQRLSVIDQFLHRPSWLALGVFVAIAGLAGFGVEAWIERTRTRDRLLMVLPGFVVWAIFPLAFGAPPRQLVLLLLGGIVAGVILVAAGWRRVVVTLLPIALAIELVGSVTVWHRGRPFTKELDLTHRLSWPTGQAAAYVQPSAISNFLAAHPGSRYTAVGADTSSTNKSGGLGLTDNRAMILRIENVGGYQAVQLKRYWLFIRTIAPGVHNRYNLAAISSLPPVALNLLDVNWIIAPSGRGVPSGFTVATRSGRLLYRRDPPIPRASLLTSVRTVPGPDEALAAVADPRFDPTTEAVVEGAALAPAPSSGGASGGTATYRSLGAQAAEVTVDAPAPALLLVRNMWDPGWHAQVDGRPASVLPADDVDQGVVVPAGRHVVRLAYDDPSIGQGLLVSAVAIAVLLGLAAFLRRREGLGEEPAPLPDPDPVASEPEDATA